MKASSTNSTILCSKLYIFIWVFFAALILFSRSYASPKEEKLMEYTQTKPYFGAYVTIHCFYSAKTNIAGIINDCWQKVEEMQNNMNVYSETGEIAKINKFGTFGVVVSESVFKLLTSSIAYSGLSGGAFDITVFPLVKLWKDAAGKAHLPDSKEIEEARSRVGFGKVILEAPNRVILCKKGMQIDLGGIVSGYACDQIAHILEAGGIANFMIDTGGEIFAKGKNKGSMPWTIGVQDPQDKNALLMTIELNNECVSTSGNYEKFYMIGSQRFSHIINPLTGYPQKDVISATVIAKTGTQADALSTALCVLGGIKSELLVSSLENVEALIVEYKEGKLITYNTGRFSSHQ